MVQLYQKRITQLTFDLVSPNLPKVSKVSKVSKNLTVDLMQLYEDTPTRIKLLLN